MVNGSVKNVFQEAKGPREQCLREERSTIRQCTYKSLNDGRDLGEIMVSIQSYIFASEFKYLKMAILYTRYSTKNRKTAEQEMCDFYFKDLIKQMYYIINKLD